MKGIFQDIKGTSFDQKFSKAEAIVGIVSVVLVIAACTISEVLKCQ